MLYDKTAFVTDPLTAVKRHPRPYATRLKRVFDVFTTFCLGLVLGPLMIPLLVLVLLIVSLDGHRPIYSQLRVGRHGRAFRLLKIRTMVSDADAALARHLAADPQARQEWDRRQKLAHDPRITRLGRFLRRTSLDELPQLWNVLRGDMSLVGPRPFMLDQARMYHGTGYYALRPGITGLWQVSDRGDGSFADRVGFDESYRRQISLGTDLRILARTFGVVLGAKGS